jgi:hypothetical protein
MARVRNPVVSEDVRNKFVYVCMVCHASCEGFYGAHGEAGETPKGTCSKSCEQVQAKYLKYPGHTEEDFFNRLGDEDGSTDSG